MSRLIGQNNAENRSFSNNKNDNRNKLMKKYGEYASLGILSLEQK